MVDEDLVFCPCDPDGLLVFYIFNDFFEGVESTLFLTVNSFFSLDLAPLLLRSCFYFDRHYYFFMMIFN